MLKDETSIQPGLFDLPADPIGAQILIPAFRQARTVKGAFGWFTAGWISRLAPGLAIYIAREDTEPIEFVISPNLYESEYQALKDIEFSREQVLEKVGMTFRSAKESPEAMTRHAVDCLAWLVAADRLHLKIAKPVPNGNYHPKIWIFDDGCDQVAVRGSANATGRALDGAIEHMDVDCTWFARSRVDKAIGMVDGWRSGNNPAIEKVYDLESALRQEIIQLAPKAPPSPAEYHQAEELSGNGGSFATRASTPSFRIPSGLRWRNGKFAHQGKAVEAWEESSRRGILEMATGAGKTITALICAYRAWREHQAAFLLVISVPSKPLIYQWEEEARQFGLTPVTPTLGKKKASIGNALLRLRNATNHDVECMIVTNHLMATPSFQATLEKAGKRSRDLKIMHIGDEAHTLGAPRFLNSIPHFVDFRLGLSATPERQYDPDGTEELYDYFGGTVFQFGLEDAIGFCLVPYDYYVHVAYLNADELDSFNDYSSRISRKVAAHGGKLDFADESLTALLIQRRAIVESADDKSRVLKELLAGRTGPRGHLLIYSTSKNPDQHREAMKIVAELGYINRQVTQEETSKRGMVPKILESFAQRDFEVLLAKKVLDEGVDIPSTREAILLSSSTVVREWIQRRGRVLRKAPGKEQAVVHDVLALPPPKKQGLPYPDNVLGLINGELERVRAFGQHAKNWSEVSETLDKLQRDYI
jgi:superfamily II DNA or RNA helicase